MSEFFSYGFPDKCGLTPVGEIDWSSGSYEFDLFVVYRDAEGRYWWADDGGCSCPSPFEDHRFPDDFDSGDAHQAVAALRAEEESRKAGYRHQWHSDSDVVELIERIMAGGQP